MDYDYSKQLDPLVQWRELWGERRIEKFKLPVQKCNNCDLIAEGQPKQDIRVSVQGHVTYKCNTCKRYKDPATGEYTIENWNDLNRFYKQKLKE